LSGGGEDFRQGGGIVGGVVNESTGEGKVKNFNFTVSQWRGLMLAICAMCLGENEGVHLDVRGHC